MMGQGVFAFGGLLLLAALIGGAVGWVITRVAVAVVGWFAA